MALTPEEQAELDELNGKRKAKLTPAEQAELDALNQPDEAEQERLETIRRARSVPQGTAAAAPRGIPTPGEVPGNRMTPAHDGVPPPPGERLTPDKNEAGYAETLLLHGLQGATARTSDELAALNAATADQVYDDTRTGGPVDVGPSMTPAQRKSEYLRVRDLLQERQKATAAANPKLALGSEVGGGMLLPTGPAGKGATAAQRIWNTVKVGSAYGVATGIGAQESGPGKIATPGEVFEAGVTGGLVGGGTAAATAATAEAGKKVVGKVKDLIKDYKASAQTRVDNRVLQEATGANAKGGAAKSIRDPLADHRELALKVIKDEQIPTADPEAQAFAARKAAQKATEAADQALDAAKPVDANTVLERLRKVQSGMKKPESIRAVQRQIDSLEDRYLPDKPLTDKDLLRRLSDGAKGKNREAIGTRDKDVIEVAKRHQLDKTVRDSVAHAKATQGSVEKVAQDIGEFYKRIEEKHGTEKPLMLPEIVNSLSDLQLSYKQNPAQQAEAAEVGKLISNMVRTWGGEGAEKMFEAGEIPEARVGIRAFRDVISAVQAKGFAGSPLDPSLNQALQRDIAATSKRTLDKYLDSIGERAEVDALNRDYSILKNLNKAAKQRAAKEALQPAPAAPPGPRDGKMTAREVNDLAEQIKPRPPSIVSQREAINVRPKKMPSEQMSSALRSLINEHVPQVEQHLQRREVADLLTQAGVVRKLGKTYAPDALQRLQKNPNLNLTGIPAQATVAAAHAGQKALDKRLAAAAGKPPKPPSEMRDALKDLIAEARQKARKADVGERARQSAIRKLVAGQTK